MPSARSYLHSLMVQRPSLSASQITRLRLQALAGRSPLAPDPAGVLAHRLAMQAQDFPDSRWAVGSPLPGSTQADVSADYDAGTIEG